MSRFWFSPRTREALERNGGLLLPDPSVVRVDHVRSQPLVRDSLWHGTSAWRALAVYRSGDRATAERMYRDLLDLGEDAEQWFARLELGALLMDSPDPTESVDLLGTCLAAPYRDVVGSAAWNLAELCRERQDPRELPFAQLARTVGDGTAIACTCERLLAAGLDAQVVEILAGSERCDCPPEVVRRYLRVLARVVLGGHFAVPGELLDELRSHAEDPDAGLVSANPLGTSHGTDTLAAGEVAAAVRVLDALAADSPFTREAAAHEMLWHSRPQLPWRAVHMLVLATLELDGNTAARRLLSGFLKAERGADFPGLNLLEGQLAADAGDWAAASEYANACLRDGSQSMSFHSDAATLLIDAATAGENIDEGIRSLEALAQDLRTPRALAALASLVARRDGVASAVHLWARAIEIGWQDFDAPFEDALAEGPLSMYDPERLVTILEERGMRRAQKALGRRPDCPESALALLASSSDEDVRSIAAEHPRIPAATLSALVKSDGSVFVLMSVAANTAVVPELLVELSQRPQASIRRAVASSARCPVAVLRQLAFDEDRSVLVAVRDNPNSPDELRALVALSL